MTLVYHEVLEAERSKARMRVDPVALCAGPGHRVCSGRLYTLASSNIFWGVRYIKLSGFGSRSGVI